MKKFAARFMSYGLFSVAFALYFVQKGIIGEVEAPAEFRK